jgi:hypothetical protein
LRPGSTAALLSCGSRCDSSAEAVVAPDGSEMVPTSKPQPDGTLVKAVARAWRWQRMLESGEYQTLADLAAAERIGRSYACRVLRLTLLAPDIVDRILAHYAWLPTSRWGLEAVANLPELPSTGAPLVVGGPKIRGATGGPSRVLALI